MITEFCAMCRGLVTRDNQTQIFEENTVHASAGKGKRRLAGPVRTGYSPSVRFKVEKLRRLMRKRLDEVRRAKMETVKTEQNDRCRIKGCSGPIKWKGVCSSHYHAWRAGKKDVVDQLGPFISNAGTGRSLKKLVRKARAMKATGTLKMQALEPGAVTYVHPEKARLPEHLCVVDFERYPEVREALEEQAVIHIRTPEEQALFYIVEKLKKASKSDGGSLRETDQPAA